MTPYSEDDRRVAALAVSRMFSGTDWSGVSQQAGHDDVTAYFTQFLELVTGARITIRIGSVTYGQGAPAGDPASARQTTFSPEGAVIMKDNEQVHATLEFDDAKGFATVDPNAVSWTVADTSVATAQPDTDGSGGCTFVAGSPGSTVGTVTDGVVSGTVAIDVTAGDVQSIKVTLGTPTAQPAAA
jgi:hypothetical protein